MDTNYNVLFGSSAFSLVCCILLFALLIFILVFWVYIACLVDVFRKTEEEFPDRNIWITLLILSLFIGFLPLITAIYYFMFKPKLRFWRK